MVAQNRTERITLLTQVSDDESTSPWIPVRGLTNLTFYLIGYGTTSGGTISYEETTIDPVTPSLPYAVGTQALIGSAVNASDVSGDKIKATRATVGAYDFVRARVSDAITGGGTISVVLVASE